MWLERARWGRLFGGVSDDVSGGATAPAGSRESLKSNFRGALLRIDYDYGYEVEQRLSRFLRVYK